MRTLNTVQKSSNVRRLIDNLQLFKEELDRLNLSPVDENDYYEIDDRNNDITDLNEKIETLIEILGGYDSSPKNNLSE